MKITKTFLLRNFALLFLVVGTFLYQSCGPANRPDDLSALEKHEMPIGKGGGYLGKVSYYALNPELECPDPIIENVESVIEFISTTDVKLVDSCTNEVQFLKVSNLFGSDFNTHFKAYKSLIYQKHSDTPAINAAENANLVYCKILSDPFANEDYDIIVQRSWMRLKRDFVYTGLLVTGYVHQGQYVREEVRTISLDQNRSNLNLHRWVFSGRTIELNITLDSNDSNANARFSRTHPGLPNFESEASCVIASIVAE